MLQCKQIELRRVLFHIGNMYFSVCERSRHAWRELMQETPWVRELAELRCPNYCHERVQVGPYMRLTLCTILSHAVGKINKILPLGKSLFKGNFHNYFMSLTVFSEISPSFSLPLPFSHVYNVA